MRRTFLRRRVRGMSHRWNLSRLPGVASSSQPALGTHPELLEGAPNPLTPADVARLLGDFGRHELHTHVSECIDHCAHWRQVVHRLDRGGDKPVDRRMLGDEGEDTPDGESNALVEARRVHFLWRHRLTILELIARGQACHEWDRQRRRARGIRYGGKG